MNFVPEGTTVAGLFECEECRIRFLDLSTSKSIVCPYCDETEEAKENAVLLKVIQGEEQVREYDILLSPDFSGGGYQLI
ncbi:MAG: hypothetical protein MJ117_10370 [Lachnospiraceae bacterium]|nr:hypothetical protein [Lachnospiraceae bacterium]